MENREKLHGFYRQRAEERQEARKTLPAEKQLAYPAERPEKKVGVPVSELLRMRSSQEPEDRFFIESLRLKIKEKAKKEITLEEKSQLEKLGKEKAEEREGLDRQLFILSAYEQGIKNEDWNVRSGTAQALGSLAPIDPERFTKFYEQGMKNEDWNVRYGTAQALGSLAEKIDFAKSARIANILKKRGFTASEMPFAYFCLRNRLALKDDLGKVILEDMPALRGLKDYSGTINLQLPEDKQSKNLEEFWDENQVRLAKFFAVNRGLALEMTAAKMNLGFARLERTMALADSLDKENSASLSRLVSITEKPDFTYFEKLMELSDAYQRMGMGKLFSERLDGFLAKSKIFSSETVNELGRTLLEEFAKKLGIETKPSEDALLKWNLEYLSKLFLAEKNFEEESREALKFIVKTTLQGDFEAMIAGNPLDEKRYSQDELETAREIQEHNLRVRKEFRQAGIDYQKWFEYPKTSEFRVGVSDSERQDRFSSFQKEIAEVAINLLGSHREKKQGILTSARANALFKSVFQKYGVSFREGEIAISKGKLSPLDIQIPLQETVQFLEKEMQLSPTEALGVNLDHLRNLLRMLPDIQKEAKQKGYQFQIKLWDRQPGHDIFQGNYTHCCIAVENFNRAAILDYLTDSGMNIIEIKDQNTGQTIGQTFIFMAQNEQGENILVLDNIELNNDYRGLERDIRQNLLAYIKEFSRDIVSRPEQKINTALLGTAYNDIETGDFYKRLAVVKKTGGPGPAGTQYLDSFGSAWVDPSRFTSRQFHVALDDIQESKKERPKAKTQKIVEVISGLSQRDLDGILDVESSVFPGQMQSGREDLRQTMENQNGAQIVIRSAQGEILGYLSSKPQSEACQELKGYDPQVRPEPGTLYVESIAIKPEARGLREFLSLGRLLFEEARRRNYKKISMHARVAEDLSAVLQKRYGAKSLRKIDNWHNFGEPFEYLEMEVGE